MVIQKVNNTVCDRAIENENSHNSARTSEIRTNNFSIEYIRVYLTEKLWLIKRHNYRINDIKLLAKLARKKLGLKKSPTRKGYDKFFTDEEKR